MKLRLDAIDSAAPIAAASLPPKRRKSRPSASVSSVGAVAPGAETRAASDCRSGQLVSRFDPSTEIAWLVPRQRQWHRFEVVI